MRLSARRLLVSLLWLTGGWPAAGATCSSSCPGATPPAGCAVLPPTSGGSMPETLPPVSSCYQIRSGTYNYTNVNVVAGGTLYFVDDGGEIVFNVKSLLVEQGGTVQAGAWCCPFGSAGGTLTIGLWGSDSTKQGTNPNPADKGIACVGQGGQCYAASRVGLCCDGADPTDPCQATCPSDHSGDNAYFEGYQNLDFDPGFFGYKVLAVSYGGSLQLFGAKGVAPWALTDPSVRRTTCDVPAASSQTRAQAWADLTGNSWARLAADADAGQPTLRLDRAVDWQSGDQLVVATTDWYPSHSELVTVASNASGTVTLTGNLAYPHDGGVKTIPQDLSTKTGNPNTEIDLRGAVGLLSRSIVIRSLGAAPDQPFPPASQCTALQPDCYFGGQVLARQGFGTFQLQGVELAQLGQGGRMGHYPVHFHQAKSTAYTYAFVKDSSLWDSNTRYVTLHATHETTLARNVGFLSLGHGFFLEDGSEIGNLLCHNLGVTARPSFYEYFAAQPASSPTARVIPPILNTLQDGTIQGSDALFPTMFWMMNTYNEFVGNKAVGVGGFGSCYWPLSSSVSGSSLNLHWARQNNLNPTYQTHSPKDYANFNQAGARQAPLLRFRGNSCSTAPYAFMTERQSLQPTPQTLTGITPVINPYPLHSPMLPNVQSDFYPTKFAIGSAVNPTCTPGSANASTLELNATYCVTTVLDRLTTSFNWAQTGFGSVWLRPWNYAVVNSAVTDQLFGGLGFVSGGTWEQVLPGYLAVTQDSVFVGTTQDGSWAGSKGPDVSQSTCAVCTCANPPCSPACPATPPCPQGCIPTALSFCLFARDGVGLYTGSYNPKRLITIYDGPFFSGGSIFTDVAPFDCTPTGSGAMASCGIYLSTNQPVDAADGSQMEVIDAAIGWKQPNGFYYPPAFAFSQTGFGAGVERHNVFDQYASYWQGTMIGTPITMPLPRFGDNTPIDFSTILNDLDGSLNGVIPDGGTSKRTAGLSNNSFYDVPYQAAQCHSFGTQTEPFDFVTTVMANLSAAPSSYVNSGWAGGFPMVPIYRQLMTGDAADACSGTTTVCNGSSWGCRRGTFMIGGQNGEAPYLTVNQGTFYIDTAPQSTSCITNTDGHTVPPFTGGSTYALYHLFATADTKVTYQLYVGTGFDTGTVSWVRVFPHVIQTGSNLQVNQTAGPLGTFAYDATSGILTVTLDNSQVSTDFQYGATPTAENCQPRDICQPGPTACQRNPSYPEPALASVLDELCGFWVTRRYGQPADGVYLSDCPANGCIGVAFTLPASFSPQSYAQVGSSLAQCYPNQPPWNTKLKAIDPECAGTLPAGGSFCP